MNDHPLFESASYRGRVPGLAGFGRLFPDARPQGEGVPDATLISWLEALGSAMRDDVDPSTGKPFPAGDHPWLPAGYTYFGQFIDHDLTFEPTVLPAKPIDISLLNNLRTPAFDLDSALGFGPTGSPHLYEARGGTRGRLNTPDGIGGVANDLPRLDTWVAVIGDPRNDENLVVSQFHTAFITFYNTVFDRLAAGDAAVPDIGPEGGSLAEKAARIVRWHYQWMVFRDFLPAMLEAEILEDVMATGPKKYRPDPSAPFMPVEFAGAAFRFGHSMVRQRYHLNGSVGDQDLAEVFGNVPGSGAGSPPSLNWALNWRRFFEIDSAVARNAARKIDPYTAPGLHELPAGSGVIDLATRNLLRGWTWGLPSGQAIAAELGVPALTAAEILTGPDGQFCKERAALEIGGFQHDTPLWYYVLKEAQVRHGGTRLGAVGSSIVADVFVGLLRADSESYFSVDPRWRPTLPSVEPGRFTLPDMFRMLPASAIDPNGGDVGPLAGSAPSGEPEPPFSRREESVALRNEGVLRYVSVENLGLACAKEQPGPDDRFEFRYVSSSGSAFFYHVFWKGRPIVASSSSDPRLRGNLHVGSSPTLFEVRTVSIGEDGARQAIRATNLGASGNWWWTTRTPDGFFANVTATHADPYDEATHFRVT